MRTIVALFLLITVSTGCAITRDFRFGPPQQPPALETVRVEVRPRQPPQKSHTARNVAIFGGGVLVGGVLVSMALAYVLLMSLPPLEN